MVPQIGVLSVRKSTDTVVERTIEAKAVACARVERSGGVHPPRFLKGNKAHVEETVGVRRKEKPVGAVETFLSRRTRPPGLDVTGNEEPRVL